jgi:hypothetical protein
MTPCTNKLLRGAQGNCMRSRIRTLLTVVIALLAYHETCRATYMYGGNLSESIKHCTEGPRCESSLQ